MNDKRATILIVDDEPHNLHVLGELLREEYEILVATNGREAIRRVHSDTPPDLILLDIMMPEMDGYEVCRKLQADPASGSIPIIFITAKDDVADETEGFQAGAVDYITKPFSPPIIQARVRTHHKLKAQADELAGLLIQDGLTGLPNRRHFDERLEDEWRRLTRSGDPFSIAMMDVDYFKQYNDEYGHGAGDECLRRVAKTLGDVVNRATDMVARYGGEEFVALLPCVDHADGMQMGDRFRRRIEALGLEHKCSPVGDCVTISVGIATCFPKGQAGPKHLLETADRMLYEAKKNGRNRVAADTLESVGTQML